MIQSISVISRDYCDRIKCENKTFRIEPGLNIIAGRNGSGKSTLFKLIHEGDESVRRGLVSVEFDEPTELYSVALMSEGRNTDLRLAEGARYAHGLLSHFKSHGESLWPVLTLLKKAPVDSTVLLDEPEIALDAKHLVDFRKLLRRFAKTNQIIIATHNPILLSIPGANIINVDPDPNYVSSVMDIYSKLFK